MIKAFKYRAYPTKCQEIKLIQTFGCVRVIWNANVESFNSYDKEHNPNPNIVDKKNLIETKPWLSDVSAAALQQKIMDFKDTVKQYFSKGRKIKIGKPSFKKKGSRQSYRLPNQKFRIVGDKIRLEKIGFVKIVIDRDIPEGSKILSCTVSRNCSGQYFVSIAVDTNISIKPKTGKEVGIDLGIKEFATLSDNTVFENQKYLRNNQSKIQRIQKHLSKKVRGSSRYKKLKLRLAKLHNHIANSRSNYIHNITSYLVNNYDIICIEDLNVSGMIKNHCLASSVSDASFSMFRSQLEYKCGWYGKKLVVIDRFYPSSKTCSCCGWRDPDLKLSDRVFKCENCGNEMDRDLNAAINIKRVGVDILYNRTQSSEVTSCGEAFIIE